MVLISTDNLERMQQLQQNSVESNNNNTVRTPGTALSRLDEEMSRILKAPGDESEKWKMYKEALWRYLRLIRVKRKREDTHEEEGQEEEEEEEENSVMNKSVNMETQTPSETSSPERLKSTRLILQNVPKTYRARARLLLKYLRDVPERISWDEHYLVTIDGQVVKDSNIVELVNEAMRVRKKAKPAGRTQFARLLCSLNIPSVLVGNKALLGVTHTYNEKVLANIISRIPERKLVQKRDGGEGEKDEDCKLFLAPRKKKPPVAYTIIQDIPSTRKRRLLDWTKLKCQK